MQEGRNVEKVTPRPRTKPSLRNHPVRKTFHAAGHCYANAAGGRCVIKMMSGHHGLAASFTHSTMVPMRRVATTAINTVWRMAALLLEF